MSRDSSGLNSNLESPLEYTNLIWFAIAVNDSVLSSIRLSIKSSEPTCKEISLDFCLNCSTVFDFNTSTKEKLF